MPPTKEHERSSSQDDVRMNSPAIPVALLSSDVTSETVTAQVKSSRVELENSDPRKKSSTKPALKELQGCSDVPD
jgi:hypothetical protein